MNLYAINEPVALATFRAQCALRDIHRHDVGAMLSAIDQHPAALLASAVDDAWIAALESGNEL